MNEVEIIAARDDVSPSLRNEIEYKLPVVDKPSSNAIAQCRPIERFDQTVF